MDLKEFALDQVKQASPLGRGINFARRVIGGLSGSTVRNLESRIGQTAMTERSQNLLGNLGNKLQKAKKFQRNARIGAGVGGGLFLAGRMSKGNGE